MNDDLLALVDRYSAQFSLDKNLVKAICKTESGWISYRTKYEKNWNYLYLPLRYSQALGIDLATECMMQSCSWGLMQIMGSVAREQGLDDYIPKLCLPEVGLLYGCKKLAILSNKFKNMSDTVSAYNQGGAYRVSDSKSEYKNQAYVATVLSNYALYKNNDHV